MDSVSANPVHLFVAVISLVLLHSVVDVDWHRGDFALKVLIVFKITPPTGKTSQKLLMQHVV